MTLSPNSSLLVQSLEAAQHVGDRFEKLKLVNVPVGGQKRGCFSLVFRAYDRIEGCNVALKFYDIDPHWMSDQYRIAAFHREHEILQTLIGKPRCLQLASAMSQYDLSVPLADGAHIVLPCKYFAAQWIDEDIDNFFLNQQQCDAIEKLKLFNEILLAVEVLHRHEVFHRDIKSDNLRAHQDALKRVVIAIDLGTAARVSSGCIQTSYGESVGAPAYAAAEARLGLAGHRYLAPYTDIYALGCLLFELFNQDYFVRELYARNQRLDIVHAALATQLAAAPKDDASQLRALKEGLGRLAKGVGKVTIDCPGHSAPPGIVPLLNDLLMRLTDINFANRPTIEWCRRRIWAAIRVLQNDREYHRRLERTIANRTRRAEKLCEKQARLAAKVDGKRQS